MVVSCISSEVGDDDDDNDIDEHENDDNDDEDCVAHAQKDPLSLHVRYNGTKVAGKHVENDEDDNDDDDDDDVNYEEDSDESRKRDNEKKMEETRLPGRDEREEATRSPFSNPEVTPSAFTTNTSSIQEIPRRLEPNLSNAHQRGHEAFCLR